MGLWAEDTDNLVFKFNSSVNVCDEIPLHEDLTFIFGIDIGYNDSDAIAVLGYHPREKKVYLVEEKIVSKQDITSLVNQIKYLKDIYKPVKMVMDAGALGKKIQEEILQRHGLHLDAAEKTRKFEFIELLNDDLRTGKFLALANSDFEYDSKLVQWEIDINNPERLKISNTYHSDITDAVLYGWRACLHYLAAPDPVTHAVGSDAYMDDMERKEAEKVQYRVENPDDWETMEAFEQDIDDIGDDFGW